MKIIFNVHYFANFVEEFLGDTLNSLEDVGDVHVTTKVGRIVISPEEAIEMHDHDDPSVEFDGTARSVYVVDRDAYCKFDYSKKGFENVKPNRNIMTIFIF